MSVWYPDESGVHENETVGRRIFRTSPSTRTSDEDGLPEIGMKDFHDSRLENDLSFDRLGQPNPSKDTLRVITKIADEDAEGISAAASFEGWATILIKKLKLPGWEPSWLPTPTKNEKGDFVNQWHTDLSREGFRNKRLAYMLAITLNHEFNLKGGLCSRVD